MHWPAASTVTIEGDLSHCAFFHFLQILTAVVADGVEHLKGPKLDQVAAWTTSLEIRSCTGCRGVRPGLLFSQRCLN